MTVVLSSMCREGKVRGRRSFPLELRRAELLKMREEFGMTLSKTLVTSGVYWYKISQKSRQWPEPAYNSRSHGRMLNDEVESTLQIYSRRGTRFQAYNHFLQRTK